MRQGQGQAQTYGEQSVASYDRETDSPRRGPRTLKADRRENEKLPKEERWAAGKVEVGHAAATCWSADASKAVLRAARKCSCASSCTGQTRRGCVSGWLVG